MKLNNPQTYQIQPLPTGGYELRQGGDKVNFSQPASTNGVAKLYTLSHEQELIYVGITKRPMAARLNSGLKAQGKGGYHGYKWKNLTDELQLTVWTASSNGEGVQLRDMETVEAEVAYSCRDISGQWPEYQHEIHFYPSLDVHRKAAKTIYTHAIT